MGKEKEHASHLMDRAEAALKFWRFDKAIDYLAQARMCKDWDERYYRSFVKVFVGKLITGWPLFMPSVVRAEQGNDEVTLAAIADIMLVSLESSPDPNDEPVRHFLLGRAYHRQALLAKDNERADYVGMGLGHYGTAEQKWRQLETAEDEPSRLALRKFRRQLLTLQKVDMR